MRQPANGENVTSCDDVEVLEFSDVLRMIDGDVQYSHTDVVYRSGDKTFSGVSHVRVGNDIPDLNDVTDSEEIPMEVFPEYDADLFGSIVDNPPPSDSYLKKPCLLDFKNGEPSLIAALMIIEAKVLRALQESPHKHLTKSLGCVVRQNRVTAICLPKYVNTLGHRVREGIHVDIESCISCIRSAILHLHSLGYAHNDVNPENIMFDRDDVPVLLDFDASKPFGENLLKPGTYGWNDNHKKVSDEHNDLKALEQILIYLRDEAE